MSYKSLCVFRCPCTILLTCMMVWNTVDYSLVTATCLLSSSIRDVCCDHHTAYELSSVGAGGHIGSWLLEGHEGSCCNRHSISGENCHHFDNNINTINSCYLLTSELNINSTCVTISNLRQQLWVSAVSVFPIVSILEGLLYFLVYMTALEVLLPFDWKCCDTCVELLLLTQLDWAIIWLIQTTVAVTYMWDM